MYWGGSVGGQTGGVKPEVQLSVVSDTHTLECVFVYPRLSSTTARFSPGNRTRALSTPALRHQVSGAN